ncbi:hypothetical protein [Amaricoccus solimangrovi]|uniref:CYTH domain-containing protein n=1 Tax=Amaricoccus solimangrovi TaxID=2589815 RepID=A0A501WQK7_9RHOB|nr:hypothetical protein [Amaricoccus solimangrovi]TPE51638.1 hypothetical protein FJM51_08010 [Amaricoccus solimangrovi]
MRISVELRWFRRGRAPDDLTAWFRGTGGPFAWAAGGGRTRTDAYLAPPDPTLGIKRRSGGDGLELKGLVDALPRARGLGQTSAFPQVFAKWRSDTLGIDGQPTVEVTKTRWLRAFATLPEAREIRLGAGDSGEEPVGGEELPEIGCAVELTRVVVAAEEWWTFGVEAYAGERSGGSRIDLASRSLDSALRALAGDAALDLREAAFQGYAEWLATRDPRP